MPRRLAFADGLRVPPSLNMLIFQIGEDFHHQRVIQKPLGGLRPKLYLFNVHHLLHPLHLVGRRTLHRYLLFLCVGFRFCQG